MQCIVTVCISVSQAHWARSLDPAMAQAYARFAVLSVRHGDTCAGLQAPKKKAKLVWPIKIDLSEPWAHLEATQMPTAAAAACGGGASHRPRRGYRRSSSSCGSSGRGGTRRARSRRPPRPHRTYPRLGAWYRTRERKRGAIHLRRTGCSRSCTRDADGQELIGLHCHRRRHLRCWPWSCRFARRLGPATGDQRGPCSPPTRTRTRTRLRKKRTQRQRRL